MATTIKTKNSTTGSTVPSGLVQGELAVNITDKKLYVGDAVGNSVQIAGAGATNAAGGSNTQVQYNSSGALAGSSNMTFDGTTLTAAGLSGPHNGTVGATTPNTGAFTTLSASGAFSANGGATLGDASGDALTINSSAVSIPNGLNFDSNTFVIDATNNRVGVGTASPAYALQVTDFAYVTGAGGKAWQALDTTASVTVGFGVNSTGGYMFTSQAVPLYFSTSGTERMRINSSGNVGIGTSSPATYSGYTTLALNNASTGTVIDLNVNGTRTGTIVANATNTSFGTWTNSYLSFLTNSTERMRLDSSGNLGLGVTPSAWGSGVKALQVGTQTFLGQVDTARSQFGSNYRFDGTSYYYLNSTYASAYQQYQSQHQWYTAPSGTAGNAITFTQAMTLDASGNLIVGDTSTPGGKFYMKGNYARFTDGTYTGLFGKGSDLVTGGGTADLAIRSDSAILFSYGSTERMRIDSSGNLLVGTTSVFGSAKLSVRNDGNPSASFYNYAYQGDLVFFYGNGGNKIGSITYIGNTTAYNTSSDYRLKENIAPMTGALATVAQLKPVTYKWKADGSDGQGFIAHELAEVVPECVTGEKDAVDADGNPVYQGIDTSFLVATLTAAIQELKAEVDSLKAQLNK